VFEAVVTAHRGFGRLDVILSNAGYGLMGAIEETRFADMRAVFETYEATKFAIEGFAEALATEARALGIRTVIIEPGAYATAAKLSSGLGDRMRLLEESAQLPRRIFFIDRGEDEQLHAWPVADGKH
jgi:NAD(P)-dependent dehydrogenase (short-subunit alcohol dehydrogenase family)